MPDAYQDKYALYYDLLYSDKDYEAEFYERSGKKVGSAILNSGDTILLLRGGHGFNILEDSKIIEVKQGPYYGVEEDKQLLETNLGEK